MYLVCGLIRPETSVTSNYFIVIFGHFCLCHHCCPTPHPHKTHLTTTYRLRGKYCATCHLKCYRTYWWSPHPPLPLRKEKWVGWQDRVGIPKGVHPREDVLQFCQSCYAHIFQSWGFPGESPCLTTHTLQTTCSMTQIMDRNHNMCMTSWPVALGIALNPWFWAIPGTLTNKPLTKA
jgi:hypothetical protein